MGNFSIALSGLESASIELNTIGNKLVDLNTTAYKARQPRLKICFIRHLGSPARATPFRLGRERSSPRRPLTLPRGRFFRTPTATRAIWHWKEVDFS